MVCQELCEDVVWPEGKGLSVEYGGNEGFPGFVYVASQICV